MSICTLYVCTLYVCTLYARCYVRSMYAGRADGQGSQPMHATEQNARRPTNDGRRAMGKIRNPSAPSEWRPPVSGPDGKPSWPMAHGHSPQRQPTALPPLPSRNTTLSPTCVESARSTALLQLLVQRRSRARDALYRALHRALRTLRM